MRSHWIRTSRTSWQQYVGRRVVGCKDDKGRYYLAYCGNEYRGCYDSLDKAQAAAESLK